MITLYVNHFRGFKDTYLPILDTNFLVGENSTGKSSILNLFDLMSDRSFYVSSDFNMFDSFEMGDFRGLTTSKYFDIGFFRSTERAFSNRLIPPYIARFVSDKDQTPLISDIVVDIGEKIILLKVYNKKRYIRLLAPKEKSPEKRFNLMKKELNEGKSSLQEYKNVNSSSHSDTIRHKGFFSSVVDAFRYTQSCIEQNIIEGVELGNFFWGYKGISDLTSWISPIRSKPERAYYNHRRVFSPDGKHIPNLLHDIEHANKPGAKKIISLINDFGKSSGLFKRITTEEWGSVNGAPFELNVTLEDNLQMNITNVGYGISQVLPIILEIIARTDDTYFLIQQPEVHLHPKAQAELGTLIFKQSVNTEKKFLIETHSDFLIDRFRIELNKSRKKKKCQVVYFERTRDGNRLTCMELDDSGHYPDEQPEGFRNFFMNEALELLEM